MRKNILGAALLVISQPSWASSPCEMLNVILQAQQTETVIGYRSTDVAEPKWIGQQFRISRYGERLSYIYVGDRRVVGWVLVEIESQLGAVYVGTWKGVGVPYTGTRSWNAFDLEAPEVDWIDRPPPLTDDVAWERNAIGVPLPVGEPVFYGIADGPFQGLDLNFAGCANE